MEPSQQRRRLHLTSEMVTKAMAKKHLGFVDAVKWIIDQYREAFSQEYQQHLLNRVAKHTEEFLRTAALPPTVTHAEAEDEMLRWFFLPVLKWYRGETAAPSPLIAYFAQAPHAPAHLARWSRQAERKYRDAYALDEDVAEVAMREELADLLPEPIREYALRRADGATQNEMRLQYRCSWVKIGKYEKWVKAWLQGNYDDERCRAELNRKKGSRSKQND